MDYSFSVFLKDFVSKNASRIQFNVLKIGETITNAQNKLQGLSSSTTKSLDSLASKLELQKAARGAATNIAQISRLGVSIRQTEREIKRLENLPPPSFLQRLKDGTKSFRELVGLADGKALLMAGVNGVTSVAKLGMDAQDTRIRFEGLLGSAGKAGSLLGNITKYANATPYDSTELAQSAEKLLNVGMAGEKIMPTLKMLGNASGGDQGRFNEMTQAFAEIASKGRLTEQSLSQLANTGFNPLQTISQNTGISLDQLNEQMAAGKVSIGMVEEAFKLATGPGGKFFGMIDKVSQSASGGVAIAMNNIKSKLSGFGEAYLVPIVEKLATFANTFFNSLDSMGAVLQPFFDTLKPLWDAIVGFADSFFGLNEATSGTTGVINFFRNALQFIQPILTVLSTGIRAIIQVLTPFAPILKVLAVLWAGWNLLLVIFNALIYANPIGFIVAGIVILIGVIVTCWQKFATFRAVIMGAWEAIKGFGRMIKDYVINSFKELLRGVVGVGKALTYLFGGDFGKAWQAGKEAIGDLMGIGSASKLIEDGKKVAGKVAKATSDEFVKKQTPLVVEGTQKTNSNTNVAPQQPSKVFDALRNGDGAKTGKGLSGAGQSSDGIINGGAKTTQITINLAKMQDQIVINTVNTGEGATRIRQILEEELNRMLGSVAAMQLA